MKTLLNIISLVFLIVLSFIVIQPFTAANSLPIIQFDEAQYLREHPDTAIKDPTYGIVQKGRYIVELADEVFAPVDDNATFTNKSKVKDSNIPSEHAKVDPLLKHQYEVGIGKLVHEKADQYNGTTDSMEEKSPLKHRGAYVSDVYSHAIRGFEVKNLEDISVFVSDPDIEVVDPIPINVIKYQYPTYNGMRIGQYQIPAAAGVKPDGIEAITNVDIAVIDGLVLPSHPDINLVSAVCIGLTSSQCQPEFHGNMVSGIAAGRDNLGGIVGVASGARIHSVAVCSHGSITCPGSAVAAFDWITARASTIEVANFSVGRTPGNPSTSSEQTAANNLVAAGVTLVVAAGNESGNANTSAYCDLTVAICVSALADYDGKCGGLGGTAADDKRATFSNSGSAVDLMAPGTPYVYSSISSSTVSETADFGGNTIVFGDIAEAEKSWPYIGASVFGSYDVFGGTSEATPWVSGAAAVLKSLHPSWTPAQIKSDLQTNGIEQNAPCNSATGLGGLVATSGSSEKILNLAALD